MQGVSPVADIQQKNAATGPQYDRFPIYTLDNGHHKTIYVSRREQAQVRLSNANLRIEFNSPPSWIYNGLVSEATSSYNVGYKRDAFRIFDELRKEACRLYSTGNVDDKHDAKAIIDAIKKSADDGNELASYFVGEMLLNGRGCEQNKLIAIRYLQKPADQGNRDAQDLMDTLRHQFDASAFGDATFFSQYEISILFKTRVFINNNCNVHNAHHHLRLSLQDNDPRGYVEAARANVDPENFYLIDQDSSLFIQHLDTAARLNPRTESEKKAVIGAALTLAKKFEQGNRIDHKHFSWLTSPPESAMDYYHLIYKLDPNIATQYVTIQEITVHELKLAVRENPDNASALLTLGKLYLKPDPSMPVSADESKGIELLTRAAHVQGPVTTADKQAVKDAATILAEKYEADEKSVSFVMNPYNWVSDENWKSVSYRKIASALKN